MDFNLYLKKWTTTLIYLTFATSFLLAQNTGDCDFAIPICTSGQIDVNAEQGFGDVDDFGPGFPGNLTGCLNTSANGHIEISPTWYTFTVDAGAAPGSTLEFIITPDGAVDYDFAVWGPNVTCGNLGTPIRCEWIDSFGDVGLSSNGGGNPSIFPPLTVNPGDTYYLLVNNWSNNGAPATITWGGNATVLEVFADPDDDTLCPGESTTINTSFTGNYTPSYQWDCNPPNGLSFLSDPTSDAPTVTIPDGTPAGTYTYSVQVMVGGMCIQDGEQFTTINVVEAPDLTINPPGVICEGGDLVTLTANPPGGTFGGIVDQDGTLETTGLTAGSYLVTYEYDDPSGCPAQTEIMIDITEAPMVDIFGELEICEGDLMEGSSPLDAFGTGGNPSYIYEWTTPGGSIVDQTIFPMEVGQYSVTVTDALGCTGEAIPVIVDVLPEPEVDFDYPFEICESQTLATITAIPYDPGFGEWNTLLGDIDPDGNIEPIFLGSGIHTFTYIFTSNDGCESINPIDIEITASPTALASNGGPYCNANNIQLFGDVDITGATVDYYWEGPNNFTSYDQNPTNATEAGEYVLIVNVNDCPSEPVTTIVELNQVAGLTIDGDNTICNNTPTILTATAGFDSYLWSDNSIGTSITITNPGNYSVIATDADGCSTSESILIEAAPDLTPVIQSNHPVCDGEDVTLTVDGVYDTYDWGAAGGSNTITVNTADTYTVIVTDANGCTGTESIDVSFYTDPTPIVFGDTEFCEDGNTILETTDTYATYTWTGNISTPTLEVTETGTYFVTVADANGCTGEAQLSVMENTNPTPTISGSTTFCSGSSTTLEVTGYDSYLWENGETTNTLSVNTPGTYTVTVTDNNNCTGEASVNVTESAQLNPVIAGDEVFCVGGSTTLDAGAGFTTYTWSNGMSGQVITVTEPGVITLDVEDAAGCEGSTQITIQEATLPDINITGNQPICTGDVITLDATGAGFTNYDWGGGNISPTLSVDEGGVYTVEVTNSDGCVNTATVTVVENALPDPTIATPDNLCAGGTITLSTTQTYNSYEWTGNILTPDLTVTTAGTYTVQVSDANNCTGEASINIVENSATIPIITGDAEICDGTVTQLDAGAGYSNYDWVGQTPGQTLEVDETGTYTVIVTDANGCTAENNFTVTEIANPDPQISGSSTICIGGSTTLEVTETFATYDWGGGNTDASLAVSDPGVYTVMVTNAIGCQGTATFTVNQSAELSPEITGDLSFCTGSSTTLTVGSAFSDYNWSVDPTNNTGTIVIDQPGNISITVMDDSGCSGDAMVTVVENNLPDIMVNGNTPVCAGESVTLSVGTYDTYNWSNASGTSVNPTFETTESGLVTVTVMDANGCENTTTVDVIVNQLPEPTIDAPTSFCSGTDVTVATMNTWTSYQWSTMETSPTISINESGTYLLTVTDAAGCTGETNITITESTELQPTIDGSPTICEGDATTLTVAGYTSYEWNTGPTGSSLEVTETGTYIITVTDAFGCTGEASFTVNVNPNPEPQIGGSTTFCSGNSTTLDAGDWASYLWDDGNGNTFTTQIIEVNTSSDYTLEVLDANGCSGTTTVSVTESTSLNPVITGDLEICEGENTTLSVSGFNAYEWQGGETGSDVLVTEAGMYTVTVTDLSNCTGEATVEVMINSLPVVDITGDLEICDQEVTTLDAGAGFDTYTWTGPSDSNLNQTLDVTTSGNYTVEVTDANGCINSDMVTVVVNSISEPSIDGPPSFCTGTTATLIADTGYDSYQWSGPLTAATETIEITEGGEYFLEVSNTNGCTAQTSFTITENSQLTPVIDGIQEVCSGDATTLDAGAGYTTYEWEGGATGQTLKVNETGTYILTVTDDFGCTGEASFNFSVNENPTVSIAGSTAFCIGGSTILDAGTGYDTYEWSDGSTTDQTITVSTVGDVSVTVTDGNGCTAEAMVSVTEETGLSPQIGGVLDFCENSSTTLDAGSGFFTYQWGDGEDTQTLTVTEPGDYFVTVSDADGCTGETYVEVTQNTLPAPDIEGLESFCTGGSVELTATAGYDLYEWSTMVQNQSITVNESGTYIVTVTDENGCIGETSITVTEQASLTPTIRGIEMVCEGGSSILDAGAGYDLYEWENGPTGQTFEVNETGTYIVTVTDQAGCTRETSFDFTVNENPTADIAGSTAFCIGSSTILDAGVGYASYEWSDGLTTSQTITISTIGDVSVTVTDNSGCTAEAMVTVTEEASLSPNINGDLVICENSSTTLDAGSGFFTYEWTGGSTDQMLEVSEPGTYFVTVSDMDGCSGETSVEVTQNTLPNAGIANAPMSFCTNESNQVDLFSELSGADAGGTWTILQGDDNGFNANDGTFDMTGQSAGTYQFQYTLAANGPCPGDEEMVTVIVNELPIVEAGEGTTLSCDDNNFTLTGSVAGISGNDISITWTGPGTIDDANSLTPTIYNPGIFTLTIENTTTSCLSTDEVEILQSADAPIVSISTPNSLTCDSTNIVLFSSSNLSTNVTYQWSGPGITNANQNEQYPTVGTAGEYTVTALNLDNNCLSAPMTITVIDESETPMIDVVLPLSQLDCNTNTIFADASASTSNGTLSYSWMDGDGNLLSTDPQYNFNQPGSYELMVMNTSTGCQATEPIIITQNLTTPVVSIPEPGVIDCNSSSTTITGIASEGGTAPTYTWFTNNGVELYTGESPDFEITTPGIYTLEVTNSETGCSESAQVEVTSNNELPIVNLQSSDAFDCTISEVSLTSTGSSLGSQYQYNWLDIAGQSLGTETSITVNNPGEYSLIITDLTNGCETIASVVAIDQTIPIETGTVAVEDPDCYGEQTGSVIFEGVVGGTPPYTYQLNDFAFSTGNIYFNLAPGVYPVAVQDAAGCLWESSVEIVQPEELTLDIGLDLDLELGDSVVLTAQPSISMGEVDTLIWDTYAPIECRDDDCFSAVINNVFNPITIDAMLIDTFGCATSASIDVSINKDRLVYIPNAFSPNNDGHNDIFMVYGGRGVAQVNKFEVFNRWGEVVFRNTEAQPNNPDQGWDGNYRGSLVNPAVYVYVIEVEFIDGEKIMYSGDVTLLRQIKKLFK